MIQSVAGILLDCLLAKQAQLWSAKAVCTSSALEAETEELCNWKHTKGMQSVKIVCFQTASSVGSESYVYCFTSK